MTSRLFPAISALSLSGAGRVEDRCSRFEKAWRAGQQARIEDYLDGVDAGERVVLLSELLLLELAYRRQRREWPSADSYEARFPADAAVIRDVFAKQLTQVLPGELTPAGEAPSSTRPLPSPAIPGYEVLEELGRGGMGVVYLAQQVELKRPVALKVVRDSSSASPEELARFRTEAEAVARLQHPNVIQVFEVGKHEGLPFFSLEFCAGGSLDRKLATTPLPPRNAAALTEVLARAVQAAHEKGVVHRDLKPANVLLAQAHDSPSPPGKPGGEGGSTLDGWIPKVTDFGLAKKLDDLGPTASGVVMGTPSYMAPEQARGDARLVGPPADVYALGAILYECLTGRPPFKAATRLDTILQVISDEPVRPTALLPRLPRDLETICLKCLRKEPGQRYASAQELAEDLRRFQAGEPIRARPVRIWERVIKRVKRRPAVTALVFLSLVVLGLAGLFVMRERARAQEQEVERARAREQEVERTWADFLIDFDRIKNRHMAIQELLARERADQTSMYNRLFGRARDNSRTAAPGPPYLGALWQQSPFPGPSFPLQVPDPYPFRQLPGPVGRRGVGAEPRFSVIIPEKPTSSRGYGEDVARALRQALDALPSEGHRQLLWCRYVQKYQSEYFGPAQSTAAFKELEARYCQEER